MVDSASSYGIDKIPQELRDLKQWTHSHSREEIKRPRHSHYTAEGCMDCNGAYTKAMSSGLSFGMYVTNADPYMVGDIDHIENIEEPWAELPISLVNLLRENPTYCEISPSGEGFRFFYKLANPSLKEDLDGMKYRQREKMEGEREAQINNGPPWMRMTGWPAAFSINEIPTLSLDDLDVPFKLRFKRDRIEVSTQVPTGAPLDSIAAVQRALDSLPMDKNPRLKRSFLRTFNEEYSHYDYWLKVIMAVHNYATLSGERVKCLEMVIDWSSKDTESYKGPEEIHTKWISLSQQDVEIGYRTLFKLSYGTQLRWPKPAKYTEAEKALGLRKKPMKTEYVNFKAMMDYYDMMLYRDSQMPGVYYLTGDEDVLDKYFNILDVKMVYGKFLGPFEEKRLIPLMSIMCQDYDFVGATHRQMQEFTRDFMAQTTSVIDMFKYYFDTPFDRLPKDYQENKVTYDRTDIDYIFSCLTIDPMTDDPREMALYRSMYFKWLLGLSRYAWYPDSMHPNNSIMLLTGPEQTRKTSHFLMMLPSFMREEFIALTTHGFETGNDMRDITKLAAESRIVFWDEIERLLNHKTESNFKKVIDNTPTKFIDKYQTVKTRVAPISIYGATSNQNQFKLGDKGSRRLFHIPVKWVDTDKLMRVNWHKLMNMLRMVIEESDPKDPPWLLTPEELVYQRELHQKITSKTNLDYVLADLWDFDSKFDLTSSGYIKGLSSLQNDNTKRALRTLQVSNILAKYGHHNVNRALLENTLARMCGNYTATQTRSKEVMKPKCSIKQGMAWQQTKGYWIMPPWLNVTVPTPFD